MFHTFEIGRIAIAVDHRMRFVAVAVYADTGRQIETVGWLKARPIYQRRSRRAVRLKARMTDATLAMHRRRARELGIDATEYWSRLIDRLVWRASRC